VGTIKSPLEQAKAQEKAWEQGFYNLPGWIPTDPNEFGQYQLGKKMREEREALYEINPSDASTYKYEKEIPPNAASRSNPPQSPFESLSVAIGIVFVVFLALMAIINSLS